MTVNPDHVLPHTVNSQSPLRPATGSQKTDELSAKVNELKTAIHSLETELRPYASSLKEINNLESKILKVCNNFVILNPLLKEITDAKSRLTNYPKLHENELKLQTMEIELRKLQAESENSDTYSTSDEDI